MRNDQSFGHFLQCTPFLLYFLQQSFFLSHEQLEQANTFGKSF